MIKVGITGQTGFIGTHLYNTLGLFPTQFERIQFRDEFFGNHEQLNSFAAACDVIVHLAAVNRAEDPDVLFTTNISLVSNLIGACEETGSKPYILFSSSIQEERDNPYGQSKIRGRKLFENWAQKHDACFSGLIIPNVFGPFCRPYYNSVVATFCHQLTHNETPEIDVDNDLNLIYVGDLVEQIIEKIINFAEGKHSASFSDAELIPASVNLRVSALLNKLLHFREIYFQNGMIPDLNDQFMRNLFNTFQSYITPEKFYPFKLNFNTDNRGMFVETVKFKSGGQVSFSTTKPGITRGNHFHTRKAERFAVIRGEARIELRKIGSDEKMIFMLNGEQPSFVDMPVWHTHNITNIGENELYTLFWTNELFNPEDPDTYFEEV